MTIQIGWGDRLVAVRAHAGGPAVHLAAGRHFRRGPRGRLCAFPAVVSDGCGRCAPRDVADLAAAQRPAVKLHYRPGHRPLPVSTCTETISAWTRSARCGWRAVDAYARDIARRPAGCSEGPMPPASTGARKILRELCPAPSSAGNCRRLRVLSN